MDTSKEYIAMCDCPKIQDTWEHGKGDLVFCDDSLQGIFYYGLDGFHYGRHYHFESIDGGYWQRDKGRTTDYCSKGYSPTWLLRQDQLQDMILNGLDCKQKSSDFYWWHTHDWSYVRTFNSMEQLWLAFVMQEKFNKKWNGEEWVTI